MANVYSTLFMDHFATSPFTLFYDVPAGFVAVVRDICLNNQGFQGRGVQGIKVFDNDTGSVIYAVGNELGVTLATYHWEGRQVMNPGARLAAITAEPYWNVRVSGYLLALP